VRGLRGLGLTPNILACRSTKVCFVIEIIYLYTSSL
jgi:hypothetical protein